MQTTEPVRYRAQSYIGGALSTSLEQAERDAKDLAGRLHEQWSVWKLVRVYNPNGSTVEVKGGDDDRS